MKKFRVRLIGLSVMLLVLAATVSAVGADSGSSAPLYLSFAKSDLEGDYVWNGTVSGDVNGDLETVLIAARPASNILHVEFDWIVSGDYSFTARLKGILDTETGRVNMNGVIESGDMLGARVYEEGQLVNLSNSGFAGTIRIMPATAD